MQPQIRAALNFMLQCWNSERIKMHLQRWKKIEIHLILGRVGPVGYSIT